MSTRTQVRFVDPDRNVVAQIYKHSDGYPDNIVPMLADLRDVLDETGWMRGPHYTAAQFMFMDKLGGLRFCAEKLTDRFAEAEEDVDTDYEYGLYNQLQEVEGVGPAKAKAAAAMADLLTDLSSWTRDDHPYFMGGHGVEDPANNIHGDEAYIYEVQVPNGIRDNARWRVKVSRRFESPEWEGRDGETRGYAYGPDEDAWSECEWSFDGSLDSAVKAIEEAGEDERDIEALENAPDGLRA